MTDTVIHQIRVVGTTFDYVALISALATLAAVIISFYFGLKPYRLKLEGRAAYIRTSDPHSLENVIPEENRILIKTTITNTGFRTCVIEIVEWEWSQNFLRIGKKIRYFVPPIQTDIFPKTLAPGEALVFTQPRDISKAIVLINKAYPKFLRNPITGWIKIRRARLAIQLSTGKVIHGKFDKGILRDFISYGGAAVISKLNANT